MKSLILLALVMQPTVTRTPDTIEVEGGGIVGIAPEAPIAEGTPVMGGGLAFGNRVVYQVNPVKNYEIFVIVDEERTEFVEALTPQEQLDIVVFNFMYWKDELTTVMESPELDYFDLIEAMRRLE